jgi:hypothetical protein
VNLLGYWEVLNSQRRVVAIGIAAQNGFLPSGGLIAQQSELGDSAEPGGRITDLAPSLEEWARKPRPGSRMGTRITVGENANGRRRDDQWLGLLINTAAGVLAVGCIVVRFARQQFALARVILGPPGYLPLAWASSVITFAVGLGTFDSFSFAQVTFLLFVILGIGAAPRLVVEYAAHTGPFSRSPLTSEDGSGRTELAPVGDVGRRSRRQPICFRVRSERPESDRFASYSPRRSAPEMRQR